MPDPAPSASSSTRWLVPTIAFLTMLGVISVGIWLGREEPNIESAEAKPSVAPTPLAVTSDAGAASYPSTTPTPMVAAVAPVPGNAAGHSPAVSSTPIPTSTTPQDASDSEASTKPLRIVGTESLTDPLPLVQPFDPGEPAQAIVTVSGVHTPTLVPDQVGAFPRVYLPLGGNADVQVHLPQAAPGDQVVAGVEDGGRFADGKPVQAFILDGNRRIAFRFQASQSPGNFRVSVRHGAQTKIMTFWAGERAAVLNR